MTAASPGIIAGYMPNRYYPSTDEYIFALADAMKEEYDTIYGAGVVLQLDCPDLAGCRRGRARAEPIRVPQAGRYAAGSSGPCH